VKHPVETKHSQRLLSFKRFFYFSVHSYSSYFCEPQVENHLNVKCVMETRLRNVFGKMSSWNLDKVHFSLKFDLKQSSGDNHIKEI
jgi:hypothetical protein